MGLVVLLSISAASLLLIFTGILVREARNPPRRTAGYAIARGLPCDPEELGLPHDAWTLDRPGGVTLPVWEIAGEPDARRPDAAVIIAHGWGQSRIDMLPLVAFWRTQVGRVVLYDLRGHGEAVGVSRLGADEHEDLLELIARLQAPSIILMGFSMGGEIALRAAAAHDAASSSIDAIITCGVYTDFHTSLRGRLRTGGLPTRPITDITMLWFRLRGLRHRTPLATVSRITAPTLLMHGAGDTVVPVDHAHDLASAIENAQVWIVEDARHVDIITVDPEGYQRRVSDLLGDSD